MVKYYSTIVGFCICFLVVAQQEELDSMVHLDAVNVLKNKHFSAGHNFISFQKNNQQNMTSTSLGAALARSTAIPFRNYGNGMLSSISSRGLSASHTGIYWEGLPLNSPLNGQADFNLYGTQSFDEVEFRSGGGSALFGSGAIGGSLHLQSKKKFNQKLGATITQNFGSFGLINSNLNSSWGNEDFYFDVSAQNLYSQNNYAYQDLSGNEREIENGRIRLNNFSGQFGYKISPNQQLQLSVWHTIANRNLPERTSRPNSNQNQEDQSTRISLIYERKTRKAKHSWQLGFLEEDFVYKENKDRVEASTSYSNAWLGRYDWLQQLPFGVNLNFGALANFSEAKGSNFNSPSRTDWTFFVALSKQFNQKIKASATVHKGFSNAFEIPFTLDFGAEYNLNKNHLIKGNFTTNYRTPTFNDLFWTAGGNQNLNPEESWMVDLTHVWRLSNHIKLNWSNTFFYGNFINWIQWLPNQLGNFQPQNIFEVNNYGIESNLSISNKPAKNWELKMDLAYQWVNAERKDNNAQLIYTPKHSANLITYTTYKNLGLRQELSYTGKSYFTTDESLFLNPFFLWNSGVYAKFTLMGKQAFLDLSIQNLLDQDYQTIRSFAMPGRHYNITIQIKL